MINWKEIQIFLFGFYCCGTIVVLSAIYNQVGSTNLRLFSTIILILGFGTIPILGKRFPFGRKGVTG